MYSVCVCVCVCVCLLLPSCVLNFWLSHWYLCSLSGRLWFVKGKLYLCQSADQPRLQDYPVTKKKSFYCRARLFINLGSRWGLGFRRHTPAALLDGKETRYTLYRRLGGPRAGPDWYGKSCPYGIRSSDLPARTDSLYRLSYPGAQINNLISGNRFRPDMPDKTIFLLCYENPTSSSRVVSCGRTVGQTGMTRVMVAFRHFANAPKNWLHTYIHTYTHTHTPRIC